MYFHVDEIILNNIVLPAYRIENLIVLVTKQFLYRFRCQKIRPKFAMIKTEMEFLKKIKLQDAIEKGKACLFLNVGLHFPPHFDFVKSKKKKKNSTDRTTQHNIMKIIVPSNVYE